MNTSFKTALALSYLLAEKISGGKAELPCDVSPTEVFSMAKKHGLGSLCASALADAGLCDDKMNEYRARSIRKILLLDAERAQISSKLSEMGIEHMPLKGVILKELYPKLGDREMSDNDILIDPSRRADVRELFESRGYRTESYGGSHDDVYLKEPIYNFEMHVSLFNNNENPVFAEHFLGALENSLIREGSYRQMTKEDFYLYITAHEYKHYSFGGTGLRSLLDAYLFRRENPELEMKKISEGLSKLGLSEYEEKRSALAKKLFVSGTARGLMLGEETLCESEAEMLAYFLGSGTYGTEKNRIENELSKKSNGSRARYIFRRIFPPMEWYEANASIVYRHKILIPFYIIKRLLVKLILSPAKIWRELKTLKKAKGKEDGISR